MYVEGKVNYADKIDVDLFNVDELHMFLQDLGMYVGGKVNYVDKIGVDLFNVDELHMFLQDLGYDPKQLMFYHYKLPNKSLDYGLRPLSCDVDVYLSLFKSTVEMDELDDDVLLNVHVVGSSKRLALG
ncbi:hypothetical protein Tco_1120410 [Tanacetum coccineum]